MSVSFNFDNIVMKSLQFDGGTGHIDLWSKQFDEESILIADMPDKYSVLTDYKIIQQNRAKYKTLKTAFGTDYRFLNVPMPRLDNADMPTNDVAYNRDPRGYLNGVFVNNYYIYPSFSRPGQTN
jgi:agmatine/peptidylarginine deiminase